MATEKQYYIGVGNASVAILGPDGVPGPYDDLKENVLVEIDLAAEYADNFSTGRDTPNRQDLHCKIKDGPVGVTLTVKENAKRTLEIALHGKGYARDAGSVVDEPLPVGFVAGQQYFTEHPNVSAVTMRDIDNNALVVNEHFKVNESGAITFLDLDETDAVKATATVTFNNQPTADTDTTAVGGKTYTWKVTPTLATHVKIGDDVADSCANLANKINTDTASTFCTAVPHSSTVTLTANTGGIAGNSIVLTTDGTRLTDGNFSGGDDADALVQPFFVSYSYGEVTEVGLLNDNPANLAVRFDGKNLTPSPKKFLRALLKEVSFAPSPKFTLKGGSNSGTANSANEYELKGVALDLDGTGFGNIEEW